MKKNREQEKENKKNYDKPSIFSSTRVFERNFIGCGKCSPIAGSKQGYFESCVGNVGSS